MAGSDTTATTWMVWAMASTSSTSDTSTMGITWDGWNEDYNSTTSVTTTWGNPSSYKAQPAVESAEAFAKRKQEEAERRKKVEEAKLVAENLLRECLSPKQEAEYEQDKRFRLIAADGSRYEIDCTQRQHNVFRLDRQGNRQEELCASPRGHTPLSDNALSQKLMLETDEKEFRRIANIQQIA